jgi:hypothetical protein
MKTPPPEIQPNICLTCRNVKGVNCGFKDLDKWEFVNTNTLLLNGLINYTCNKHNPLNKEKPK